MFHFLSIVADRRTFWETIFFYYKGKSAAKLKLE